jgi:hypothetical protein
MPKKLNTISLKETRDTKEVTWHLLKVIYSFNDHQERLCMIKWAKQISAEMTLDDLCPKRTCELIVFEFQRAYFQQLSNRYA